MVDSGQGFGVRVAPVIIPTIGGRTRFARGPDTNGTAFTRRDRQIVHQLKFLGELDG
jgi:hypothetical protein